MMIRRSLTLALRTFGQAPKMCLPNVLTPVPFRMFAFQSYDRNDFDAGNEETERAPRQNRPGYGSDFNRDFTFRPVVFEGMAKLPSSEILEFLFKQKGSDSAENFVINFFNSISVKEGYIAWSKLTVQEREQFLKNFMLLVEESLSVQSRFPIGAAARHIFRLILSQNDTKMALELLTSLTSLLRSTNSRLSVIGAMLTCLNSRSGIRLGEEGNPIAKICEQAVLESLQDIKNRGEARNQAGFNVVLSNYLAACVNGLAFDRSNIMLIANYLVGLQLNEIIPNVAVDIYISLACLSQQRLPIVFHHPTNVEFMNYCINKHLVKEPRALKDGETETRENPWKCEFLTAGKQATHEQIFGFVQAYIMENDQSLSRLRNHVERLAENITSDSISPQFRRFVQKFVSSTAVEELDRNNFKKTALIVSRFLSGPRNQKIRLAVLKKMNENFIAYRDTHFLAQILPLFSNFRSLINKNYSEQKEEGGNQKIFDDNLTAEEQAHVKEAFEKISAHLLNEELNLSFHVAITVIRNLVGNYGVMTASELKTKKIHRDLWDRAIKKNKLGAHANSILSLFTLYDLPADLEMQKIMSEIIEKEEFKIKDHQTGEFKGMKYPRSLEEIHTRFLNKKGQLVGESLVFLERLDKMKSQSLKSE